MSGDLFGESAAAPIKALTLHQGLNMKHSIERTNPKGEPFVGVCILCGEQGLKFEDATKDCPNVRGLSQDEALVEAVNPKRH